MNCPLPIWEKEYNKRQQESACVAESQQCSYLMAQKLGKKLSMLSMQRTSCFAEYHTVELDISDITYFSFQNIAEAI